MYKFSTLQILMQVMQTCASPMAGMASKNGLKKYAVVTGANKGIGLEICRQLACEGISVVLTARNDKRGLEAIEKLKTSGLADYVTFHQLDVMDFASVDSLAGFIKSRIGKLDILVNNAGIGGTIDTSDAREASASSRRANVKRTAYDLAEECLQTNYYGAKRTAEALLPLLQLSVSPKIINVSSTMGKLNCIPNEWARQVLNDVDSIEEENIDQVLNEFLKDFKEGSVEAKGWPRSMSAYVVSKVALNSYTRILAKKYPSCKINCVCPGYVKTDLSNNAGILTVEEGAKSPVRLAMLGDDGPTGLFFDREKVTYF